MSDLTQLEKEILAGVAAASDEASLEAVRVAALGKSGSVTALLKTLGTLSPEERKEKGAAINQLKDRVTAALAARKEALKDAALNARLNTEMVDVTLPTRESPAEAGRVHPISQVVDELTAIFADMGFAVAEGPDIETDDNNFTKLNFPEGHPAREMHDTFFFNPKPDGSRLLLRKRRYAHACRLLGVFMALAGNQHHIGRRGFGNGLGDGCRSVGLGAHGATGDRALQDLVQDGGRVFAAGVVAGHQHLVGL
ncbi:MAG: hypothetical protein WEC82_05745, partial [Xanthobacteraceae bacterium]